MAPSRMARNATALSVAKVADPAAGSGGLEALTRQLCGAAWSQFQENEGAGGVYAALANGLIQRKVAAVRAEREAAVARGREALTGTTKFSRHTRTSGRCTRTCANEATRGGTSGHRAAPEHPFGRALRRLARRVRSCPDRHGCTSQGLSRQPRHAIGFHGAHHLREEFFEGGGIEAITNDGFANLDDLVEAFKVSGARLVCLCSSNDIYARQATVTATELSKSPETYVYLAGRPAELEVMLKAAGVRSLICAGCDVLGVLQGAHAFLGIEFGSVH